MPFPPTQSTAQRMDMSRLHAIVLAGGRGSRLHGLTAGRAKPAVAFGGTYRLLDFTLSNCLNSGLHRISVLAQYRSDTIEHHLRGGWLSAPSPGGTHLEVLRSQLACGYGGTADAVHQQLCRLRRQGVLRVVILAGDHVCKMDLRRLLQSHVAGGAGITVAALELPAEQAAGTLGVMRADADGRVLDFEEKPARPAAIAGREDHALVSMGIYAADLDVLQALLALDANDPCSSHDLGRDVLPRAAAEGLLAMHRFEDSCVREAGGPPYWRDVGSLDQYWQAHRDLAGAAPPLDLFDPEWPLLTRPCVPAPSHLGGGHHRTDGVAGCLVAAACRIDAASVRGSVVSSGVAIRAGGVIEDCVLLPGATVGRHARLRRVIVDERCTVPDGLRVGFDVEQDRARFHVTPSGVTLITAAMLDSPMSSRRSARELAAF